MSDLTLNYHLMHPGGESAPGDPNAAFSLDGVYHLHYILGHPWQGERSYSFVHVTSPDMLHWTWQTTKLQPAFTGHAMYSGTGFLTKEGRPAVIYHGKGSGPEPDRAGEGPPALRVGAAVSRLADVAPMAARPRSRTGTPTAS